MEDILLHILPYLDLKTVLNCRQVNQNWSEFIDKNKRFWIRELRALKFEKIYFSPNFSFSRSKTICDIFPDWQKVFDYFEKEVETDKLREFVCALQAPYDYLRTEKDDKRLSEIFNPMHIEAWKGRHKLLHLLMGKVQRISIVKQSQKQSMGERRSNERRSERRSHFHER